MILYDQNKFLYLLPTDTSLSPKIIAMNPAWQSQIYEKRPGSDADAIDISEAGEAIGT